MKPENAFVVRRYMHSPYAPVLRPCDMSESTAEFCALQRTTPIFSPRGSIGSSPSTGDDVAVVADAGCYGRLWSGFGGGRPSSFASFASSGATTAENTPAATRGRFSTPPRAVAEDEAGERSRVAFARPADASPKLRAGVPPLNPAAPIPTRTQPTTTATATLPPRGVYHHHLIGRCDFLRFPVGLPPDEDRAVVAPGLRLFFGQVRCETTPAEIRWLLRETCGVEAVNVEPRLPGSFVVFFDSSSDKRAAKALNKRLLFDNTGVWAPRTAGQSEALAAYVARGLSRGGRCLRLPKEPLAVEEERGRTVRRVGDGSGFQWSTREPFRRGADAASDSNPVVSNAAIRARE